MQLSIDKIRESAEIRWGSQDMVHDYASEFGEPGWASEPPKLILLGDWNERGPRKHPRVADALEAAGVELLWYDEWTVDSNTGKVWRTSPDSYGWECPVAWWDGELMTPDDDFETWLDYAIQEGEGLNRTQVPDLERKLTEAGFTRVPEDDNYESGWHPGQTDDPDEIMKAMRLEHGPAAEIVFALVENSQFYIRFAVFYRIPEQETE